MSLQDKIDGTKRIVSLVCEVIPLIVTIVKETILLLKTA